jgi:hypothetical protein
VAEEDQGAALGHRREAAFGQLVPLGGGDGLPDDRQDVLLFLVEVLFQAGMQFAEISRQGVPVAGACRALPRRQRRFGARR